MYLIETSACLDCLQSIISCRHVVSHASQASHSASAQTAFSKKKLVIYYVNFHHILILGVYLCLGYFAEIIEE